MSHRRTQRRALAVALPLAALFALGGCASSLESPVDSAPMPEVTGEVHREESPVEGAQPDDGVTDDAAAEDHSEPDVGDATDAAPEPNSAPEDSERGWRDSEDGALTLPPSVLAQYLTIRDGVATVDVDAEGLPLRAADIPADPGYVSVPNRAGRYYFFVGETRQNSDGGYNWYVNVPAEADARLSDRHTFHMIGSNGTYSLMSSLWSYAHDNGDVTYLIYDPELGPACQGDCAEVAGTEAGRFVAIVRGD